MPEVTLHDLRAAEAIEMAKTANLPSASIAKAPVRNRKARKLVGSGRMVSLRHLSLRYPRFEEEIRASAKRIDDEWKALGEQMRLHREAAGLSLRHLAEHLEISPPFLSDMERGFRHYTLRYAGPAIKLFEANIGHEPRRT